MPFYRDNCWRNIDTAGVGITLTQQWKIAFTLYYCLLEAPGSKIKGAFKKRTHFCFTQAVSRDSQEG